MTRFCEKEKVMGYLYNKLCVFTVCKREEEKKIILEIMEWIDSGFADWQEEA